MNKTYRLQKDLPNCPKGAFFEENSCGDYYCPGLHNLLYKKNEVEGNPEWFAPFPTQPKEYEILSFKVKNISGAFLNPDNGNRDASYYLDNPNEYEIYSVIRFPDGEVFTIGDFVRVKKDDLRKGWSDPIEKFIINDGHMVCEFATWRQPLSDIERMHKEIHVKQPVPKPRIQINDLTAHDYINKSPKYIEGFWYQFKSNHPLWEQSNLAIKSAIENILNGESTLYDGLQEAGKQIESLCKSRNSLLEELDYYKKLQSTQEYKQLEAFYAGKAVTRRNMGEGKWEYQSVYTTFEDYKKKEPPININE